MVASVLAGKANVLFQEWLPGKDISQEIIKSQDPILFAARVWSSLWQALESIFSHLPRLLNSLIYSAYQGEALFNLTTGVLFSVFLYPLNKVFY